MFRALKVKVLVSLNIRVSEAKDSSDLLLDAKHMSVGLTRSDIILNCKNFTSKVRWPDQWRRNQLQPQAFYTEELSPLRKLYRS